MDHLPEIANHNPLDSIEVPYLSELQYDGQDFRSYPQRRGWNIDKLRSGDLTEKSPQETQSMLQTWLYFGLLSQVLGISVPEDRFVTTSPSGRRLITTRQLPGHVQFWRDQVRGLANEEQRLYLLKVSSYLKIASFVLRFADYSRNQPQLDGVICLSIAILASSIDFTIYTSAAEFNIQGIDQNVWPRCPLLRARMLKAGWCESEVARFEGQSLVSSMYFGSALQRRKPPFGRSHKNCSKETCVAKNYAENEYKTSHTADCCGCKPLGPDIKETTKIISQSGFPVLQLTRTSEYSAPCLQVLDGAKGIQYVAISHVWADGLGNEDQNQLFQCQLLRLQQFVNDLWESTSNSQSPPFRDLTLPRENSSLANMPFWIDTICVPKEQPFRTLAVSQMRFIYEKAQVVLVLDSELQQQSLRLSYEELLLRISFSGWTRRIWTLQEGILARILYFKMCDGFFPFFNVRKLARKSISNTSPLLMECSNLINEIVLSKETTGTKKFCWTWNHLRMRTTSHPNDFPVVFACLLGLDLKEVLSAPEGKRMITLISQISEFPQGIIFTTGPRIHEECYRWAPNLPPMSAIHDQTPVYRKQLSLMVVLPGFTFNQDLSGQGAIFPFEDADDHRYYVLNFSNHRTEVRPCDETWSHDGIPFGLMLQTHCHQLTSELECAVLVCIDHETAGVIHAKFLCHVSVGYLSPYEFNQAFPNAPKNSERLSARKLDLGQKWAID